MSADINSFCRFCGNITSTKIDIFDERTTLIDVIHKCLPIKIKNGDNLPHFICEKCNLKVRQIDAFICLVLENEERFKAMKEEMQINRSRECVNRKSTDILTDKTHHLPNLRNQKFDKSNLPGFVNPTIVKKNRPSESVSTVLEKLQNSTTGIIVKKINMQSVCDEKVETEIPDELSSWSGSEYNDEDIFTGCTIDVVAETGPMSQYCCPDAYFADGNPPDETWKNMRLKCDDCKNRDDEAMAQQIKKKKPASERKIAPVTTKSKTSVSKVSKVLVIKMNSPAAYVCIICREKFETFEQLKQHIKTSDKCQKVHLTCEYCGKICDNKRSHYQHTITHKEKSTYVCDECGKTYSNRFNLENHKSSFHGEQIEEHGSIYKCKVCDKQFTNRRELYIHINLHSKEPSVHLCESCGKCFQSLESLRSHIRIHQNIRPFKCVECDKGFRSRLQLTQHSHVHTGIKPFNCNYCKRAFAKKGSLIAHTRTHTGETPYKCSKCDAKFMLLSKFKIHNKNHTLDL